MPIFWKELLIRLTVCSLCIMSICYFGYFPYWVRGWDCGSDCANSWLLFTVYEPRCEKTGLRGFLPGPTQTGLYNHRRWLEAEISHLGSRGIELSV